MPTLEESINLFLKVDRSEFTTNNYRHVLEKLADAIGKKRRIERISHEDLLDYLQLLRTRKLSQRTLEQYVTMIKTFFRWLLKNGYLTVSPAEVMQLRKAMPEPVSDRAMPPEILTAIIEYTRRDPRYHAIVLFFADTGCRAGGAASLQKENLFIDKGEALILEKGSIWVYVYFSEETGKALQRWLDKRPQCDHDYVFTSTQGKPLDRRAFGSLMERLSLKVTDGKEKYRTHSIRHAVGNAYGDRFTPAVTMRKMNHARSDTTIKYYYAKSDELMRRVSRQNPLISARPNPQSDESKIVQFSDLAKRRNHKADTRNQ